MALMQSNTPPSQSENQVRADLGSPLGDTSLNSGCVMTLNLLGEADRMVHELMAKAYRLPGATVHWHDKEDGMTKGGEVSRIMYAWAMHGDVII